MSSLRHPQTPQWIEDSELDADTRTALLKIGGLIEAGMKAISSAARVWIDLDEEERRKVIAAAPASHRAVYQKLEQVGFGHLHPQLVMAGGRGAQLLGKLPLEEQGRYLEEMIPVSVMRGQRRDVQLMDVEAMGADQVKQVFKPAAGGKVVVRTIAEQRAWLAAQERQEEAKAKKELTTEINRPGRWSVRGGKVFLDPAKAESGLTLRDVRDIIKDLNL